jgi:SAM-dependent methyltransferase
MVVDEFQLDKFHLQDAQYVVPYHYLPMLEGDSIKVHQALPWGLEYLTYMSHVVELIKAEQPSSLLDIGCGDGRLETMLHGSIPMMKGIDLSERAIAFARAFNPDIAFESVDVSAIDDRFDAITLVEVLEHVPDSAISSLVRDAAACLEEHGFLLVTVPTVNLPMNRKHYRHYTLELLTEQLSPTFQIDRHWWVYHTGLASTILTRLLYNRWFALNHRGLRRLIWQLHRRYTYMAGPQNGAHLVALAHKNLGQV